MAKNRRKAGSTVAFRDRRTGRGQGHIVLEVLRPEKGLEILRQADERERFKKYSETVKSLEAMAAS